MTPVAILAFGLVLSPTPTHVVRPHAAGRAGRILCGWGPDPVWSDLTIKSIADAGEGLKAITVDVPAETVKGFTTGGQYVQLREPGAEKAAFIAIASAPAAGSPFEFLVKEQVELFSLHRLHRSDYGFS